MSHEEAVAALGLLLNNYPRAEQKQTYGHSSKVISLAWQGSKRREKGGSSSGGSGRGDKREDGGGDARRKDRGTRGGTRSRKLATGGFDEVAMVWSVDPSSGRGKLVHECAGHTGKVTMVVSCLVRPRDVDVAALSLPVISHLHPNRNETNPT